MIFKIYIADHLKRAYLRNWYVVNGFDCVVFTTEAKCAMRFTDRAMLEDYIYQLRANGYTPKVEAIK